MPRSLRLPAGKHPRAPTARRHPGNRPPASPSGQGFRDRPADRGPRRPRDACRGRCPGCRRSASNTGTAAPIADPAQAPRRPRRASRASGRCAGTARPARADRVARRRPPAGLCSSAAISASTDRGSARLPSVRARKKQTQCLTGSCQHHRDARVEHARDVGRPEPGSARRRRACAARIRGRGRPARGSGRRGSPDRAGRPSADGSSPGPARSPASARPARSPRMRQAGLDHRRLGAAAADHPADERLAVVVLRAAARGPGRSARERIRCGTMPRGLRRAHGVERLGDEVVDRRGVAGHQRRVVAVPARVLRDSPPARAKASIRAASASGVPMRPRASTAASARNRLPVSGSPCCGQRLGQQRHRLRRPAGSRAPG